MSRPAILQPVPQAPGLRVALVVSTYHDGITERLAAGAREALAAAGVSATDVERLDVPGAYEIPFGARTAAASGRVDAIVCLGCLIKGETPHFDYIASAVSHGMMQASLAQGVPMAFGVLTVNTQAEAEARVPEGPGNKGYEAAVAAVTMALLAREWQAPARGQGSEG
ncbi:6,7-dimethyl-8-ribityllumazine synthase [Luteitalea sp. TBR-22]|uniref:6,7-dimethyl-8-ribityllumazine synthase n=1 Tax=Luteitalea sp. TBR-22 TaxID=2802971 RepID=UPI001AF25167|nr:6,7-dimethyl-8-ribityllumazine synthase [Luteitalea sp. TBR-22]BCS34146.1 6,7-dimethyl-8-ribityllumazine synthase [Luteitalea sp. TBR-22]